MSQVTNRLARENRDTPFSQALLQAMPMCLGKTIAANIEAVRLEGTCLYLKVPDPLWLKELGKSKKLLLEKARTIHPELKGIVLEP